ncbi:glucans biosynthesis glucosyltransferase MdoH [Sediminicurvatus halobius]|uniref:Glucans biosynthesis glucosyltransferase H n=1 Tax=Sediminicurvatus halobius TaxID=2182432 RepID=A0A2U2MWJ9_9GAMM|nr:glucans biosynthesis glucosyltransferase MdoH [Spiribacter halobius]PWG61230.1 glucans biosynthesis glucosyltransferase MdoH [Spiribacter halobius]UEX79202.1 glucans biosynthesis glucosyltransferase MdoH [Spiribacter halobius]
MHTNHSLADPLWPIHTGLEVPLPRLRRLAFFSACLGLTAYLVALMFGVLAANGLSPLEGVILALFTVTSGWIAVAFCTAATGAALLALGRDPLSLRPAPARAPADLPITTRTAIVMPVHNEDVTRVIAGFEAVYRDLQRTGEGSAFDFYLLSDSTDEAIATEEAQAWAALCRRLQGCSGQYYRRRTRNEGRKAGNIAEFCRRWGERYEYLVVLDADSLMSGRTLTTLVRTMQVNPTAGILQTVPQPVGQRTPFARMQQFAAALYAPMLATGMSFWQTDTANYWGHNAILRTRPFMDHCGLPVLSGRPPLGGEILSHDFVEAALMRRGGWYVYLLPEIGGSYEELPGNVLDHAKRDRRWAEGNLQHLRLLAAYGLHTLNRLYFLMGALAYGCSFLWLALLLTSTADALQRALRTEHYFVDGYQLFPRWPVTRGDEILWLLGIVVAMLVLPKVLGVALTLGRRASRLAFGGAPPLLAGAVLELVFSVVLAPVMMTFHAWFVACVLCGRRVSWNPQNRCGRTVPWSEALRHTVLATAAGVFWGGFTLALATRFFWALTPVLVGLVLAAPLVVLTSQPRLGERLLRLGLFVIPAERQPPAVLADLEQGLATRATERMAADYAVLRLPLERPRPMPAQSLAPPLGPTGCHPRERMAHGLHRIR